MLTLSKSHVAVASNFSPSNTLEKSFDIRNGSDFDKKVPPPKLQ